jgi:hypothetical protein
MPRKVVVTPEEFARFDQGMVFDLDCGYLTPEEIERERRNIIPPKRRRRQEKGQEVGYYFRANGLTLKVWTSWLKDKGRLRKSDQGWVLITDENNKAVHFVHPLNRTKNFLRRLYNYAKIERQRMIRRPVCPHCGTYLPIVRGDRLKERAWACQNIQQHPEQTYVVVGFNDRLDPNARAYVERDERRSERYHAKREAEGKPIYVMMLSRAGSITMRSKQNGD